jgi:bacteriorhodopsin
MSTYSQESKTEIPQSLVSPTVPLIPRPPDNVAASANTISPTKTQDKIEAKTNPVQYYVKASFMITYILLLTTATITFIEAMRTENPQVRHVLNLETCISVVAGYFYSIFITQIEGYSKENKQVDWADITKTRYIDWTITTPLMLLTLCIVLGNQIGKKVNFYIISIIIFLNYLMLYIGYLGETNVLDRFTASFLGFVPFTILFYTVFKNYVGPKYDLANYVLYGVYIIVWSLYGIVYLLKEEYKNITMNILDCTSKCIIGLGLWVYYSKIIVL